MRKFVLFLILSVFLASGAFAEIIHEIQVTDDVEQEDAMDAGQDLPEIETGDLTVEELQELAQDGDMEALLAVADCYYYGKCGVQRNRVEAFKWYEMAALLDNPTAQFSLGHMYRTGNGAKKNMQKALEWFEKAANLGDTESQFMVAEMYGLGTEVPRNVVKAYKWYNLALDGMEPRFKGIIKAELDLLKDDMTKDEVAAAEKMAVEWRKAFAQKQKELAQN